MDIKLQTTIETTVSTAIYTNIFEQEKPNITAVAKVLKPSARV